MDHFDIINFNSFLSVGDNEFFNYEDYISYQKDKTLRTVLISDIMVRIGIYHYKVYLCNIYFLFYGKIMVFCFDFSLSGIGG